MTKRRNWSIYSALHSDMLPNLFSNAHLESSATVSLLSSSVCSSPGSLLSRWVRSRCHESTTFRVRSHAETWLSFYTIFHQFGTKQTHAETSSIFWHDFHTIFLQFRWAHAEIPSTFSENFSSIGDQTDLQKSRQLFGTIFHQLATKQTGRHLINFLTQFSHNFPSVWVNFLTQFAFNSSGQSILSGHFAVITVCQLNFLTQSFLISGPKTTMAVFDFAELFDYFEQFGWRLFRVCLFIFETMPFQWHLQYFEAILRENSIIIESSFGRSCNPQFKAFNLKFSFLLKSSTFSLAFFTSFLKSTFLGMWRRKWWQWCWNRSLVTWFRWLWVHDRCLEAVDRAKCSPGKCGQLGFSGFG
jgi:hypothetical protein